MKIKPSQGGLEEPGSTGSRIFCLLAVVGTGLGVASYVRYLCCFRCTVGPRVSAGVDNKSIDRYKAQ